MATFKIGPSYDLPEAANRFVGLYKMGKLIAEAVSLPKKFLLEPMIIVFVGSKNNENDVMKASIKSSFDLKFKSPSQTMVGKPYKSLNLVR